MTSDAGAGDAGGGPVEREEGAFVVKGSKQLFAYLDIRKSIEIGYLHLFVRKKIADEGETWVKTMVEEFARGPVFQLENGVLVRP